MTDKIDYISIDNCFWIQFNKKYVSFGLRDLPSDIHLTISYNPDLPDINFHLTKNTSNQSNKPKIEIFRISKNLLELTFERGFLTFLFNMVEPIDTSVVTDGSNFGYISTNEIESKSEEVVLSSFKEGDYQIKKKRRLKITSNIEERFNELSRKQELQELYKTMIKPLNNSMELMDSGIVTSATDSIVGIKLFGTWYKFRDKVELSELFNGLVEQRTIKQLKRRFKESIIKLRTAESFSDTEDENKRSIVLVGPKSYENEGEKEERI